MVVLGRYINGASLVDVTDPKFHLYVVYKVANVAAADTDTSTEGSSESKEEGQASTRRYVAGFMTTYRFTNPLRQDRPVTRSICQALILPPFQKLGLGGRLLEVGWVIHEWCANVSGRRRGYGSFMSGVQMYSYQGGGGDMGGAAPHVVCMF